MMKPRILVLCTGNSCRSQIAEAYLKYYAGESAEVYSAGIEAHGLNPWAVKTMAEEGIDISGQTSDTIDALNTEAFDYVITVCDNAKENCPYFPAKTEQLHQNFPDPAKVTGTEKEIAESFRKVREQIKAFTRAFVETKIN